MDPTVRYELRPGEWRADPPHVSYGCDRTGLVATLGAEQSARAWTRGESEAGPVVEVDGRALGCPPTSEDVEWLESIAEPAPYGRGEETVLDPAVREALQIGADHLRLGGCSWKALRAEILGTVAADMGLADATLELKPLKLLLYRAGGHFSAHADTEKAPGMVASLALIVPGEYEGGALVGEHAGERLCVGAGGTPRWRWAAWYADCRHWLEPVRGGVRIAVTVGVAIDGERPIERPESEGHRVRSVLWSQSYAEWPTEWAARGGRTRAGGEQYGQKMVWVLAHRYTEPGLRASLLKGRDRELARLLVDEPHAEACYLGWLHIREVGTACTAGDAFWGDDTIAWEDRRDEEDDDLPPDSMVDRDPFEHLPHDPAPHRIAHRETPELHLEEVARQNVWIEGLRSLRGEDVEHGPIEVLDGEIVPAGALAQAAPSGARVYEATGNEGASLELQYRHAVLVVWRRNAATLRMLARCGGRLALAVELAQRMETEEHGRRTEVDEVLALWSEALATDGGGPEPRAHRLVLNTLEEVGRGGVEDRRRGCYVESVAAVDLDAEAVPTLLGWIRDRLDGDEPMEAWMRALRTACGGTWMQDVHCGVPALLRGLCENPRTRALAVAMVADHREAPTTPEAVMRHADWLDERLTEQAWTRRRVAKMTMDDSHTEAENRADGDEQ